MITRRRTAALAAAALAARALPAVAADNNTFVSGITLPTNLDPHQVFDVPMQTHMLNVYDTLYRYEGDPAEIVPWLADSHSVSPDGLTWEFRLRPGARFHDGSPVTAADVAYSFRRVLSLRMAPAGAFLPVLKPEKVSAPEPLLVRFQLEVAYAPFLAAIPIVAVVNPRVIAPHETNGDWARSWLANNAAGSGAYTVDAASYRPSERLDLRINADHFKGWSANPRPITAIACRPTKETSTRVLALLNGSLDCTDGNLPADQVDRINSSRVAAVAKNLLLKTYVVRMNNTKPPFDNINARMCFAHAFNYMGFIDDILGGYATRNPQPMPNNLWGCPQDVKGYDYDLAMAKSYMAKAVAEGAPMRRPIELHVQSEYEQSVQGAQVFQADLATLGINLRIVPSTFAAITTSTAKAVTTPDMWQHWVSTYFVDPENWIGQMYDSQFHGTWKASSWYKNDQVDRLLRQARGTVDQARRKPLYEKAVRLVMADCPDIWISNSVQLQGVAKRVEGRRFCTVGQGAEVRWMTLKA